jgi:hypothetical protein
MKEKSQKKSKTFKKKLISFFRILSSPFWWVIKVFIMPFFFSKGKFNPPYFWITFFLYYAIKLLNIKTDPIKAKETPISDSLVLGVLGFVFTWLSVYNVYKYFKNKNNGEN